MPRPFPFPINVGTDICSVNRIFNILKSQNGSGADAFLRRILTDQEREQFRTRSYSKTLQLWHNLQKKRVHLDKRREELGIPQTWRDQLALIGRGVQDTSGGEGATTSAAKLNGAEGLDAMNDNGKSQLETFTQKVNNVDILRRLEDEMEDERDQILLQLERVAQFLAGRFAAKEAAMKAHRHRRLTWHDIWIQAREAQYGMSQAPEALIISEAGSWEDAQIVPLSISHDEGYSTAVCLAAESDPVAPTKDGDLGGRGTKTGR